MPIHRVDRERLDALTLHHQGVVAEAAPLEYATFEDLLARIQQHPAGAPIVLVLDSLQDPQNFGTLLRTAAAVGVSGVVLPEHRAVGVTPAVAKVASGATEHLTIVRATNLARALADLTSAGLWVVGLDAHGGQSLDATDLAVPLALVVGGEGKGLGRLIREACDLVVSLPMTARTESLNAAVAGSIVLYDAFRRRAAGVERTRPSSS